MPKQDVFGECAVKLKILGDPTRMRVLGVLMEGPRLVRELRYILDVEQSLLSHHLRSLRDARLVEGIRVGKAIRYQVAASARMKVRGIDLGFCQLVFRGAKAPALRAPGDARARVELRSRGARAGATHGTQ